MYDPRYIVSVKLLTRLRIQFNHQNELKFKHGFSNAINPMCACGTEVETTEHFPLLCHFYSTQESELFDQLEKVDPIF